MFVPVELLRLFQSSCSVVCSSRVAPFVPVESVDLFTPCRHCSGSLGTWLSTTGRHHVVLSVRASLYVRLDLSPVLGEDVDSVFVVVRDLRSIVWFRGAMRATNATPSMLDGDAFRGLWVGWEGGTVRVGRGKVPGVDVVLQWTRPGGEVIVKAVGLVSAKPAHWKVNTLERKCR